MSEWGDILCCELALAGHVGDLDPSDGCSGGMEGLEAHHRTSDLFDEAVIVIQNIVGIFDLQDPYDAPSTNELQDHVQALQTSQIGTALVDDHSVWQAIGAYGLFEKSSGCDRIPALGQHEIKSLAVAIDGSIEVCPLASNLGVRFVGALRTDGRALLSLCG